MAPAQSLMVGSFSYSAGLWRRVFRGFWLASRLAGDRRARNPALRSNCLFYAEVTRLIRVHWASGARRLKEGLPPEVFLHRVRSFINPDLRS